MYVCDGLMIDVQKWIGMIQIQSIYLQPRLVKISKYTFTFDQNIFYTFEMRSTPLLLRPKSHRILSLKLKQSTHGNESLPQYSHIDFALQTLDNTHSLMLLQSLEQLAPHHLCLKTKLVHLLNQHHFCLDSATQSLLATPLCPPCLDIYFQHFASNNQHNLTLRSKLIDSLSIGPSPELVKYLMRLTELTPRVSRYRQLMEQLRKNQCSLDKVQILEVHNNNRRIIATANINKDEQILFIPKDKLITLELARTLPLVSKLSTKRGLLKSPKHTELAVYLLHEFEKGQQSLFYNYLSTLPTDFSHFPINYSQEMIHELQGTCFLEQVETKQLDLKKDYEIVVSLDQAFSRFSFNRFVQVRLLVCSRVFGIMIDRVKTDAMVPLADMLNHHIPKQTSWYYCDISKGFVIQSLQDINAGTEIFDSYGQKCNSRFLLNYGFTLPSNIHNQVIITLNLASSSTSRQFPSNVRVRVNRILESKSFQDMMSLLRIAASVKQGRECESEEEQPLENIKHMAFKSIQNQIKAMQLLENLISERLKDYPTTLNQDKKLLEKSQGVLADIITLRMGEKEVLHYFLTMAKKICKFLGNRSKRSQLASYQTYIASLELQGRDQQ